MDDAGPTTAIHIPFVAIEKTIVARRVLAEPAFAESTDTVINTVASAFT